VIKDVIKGGWRYITIQAWDPYGDCVLQTRTDNPSAGRNLDIDWRTVMAPAIGHRAKLTPEYQEILWMIASHIDASFLRGIFDKYAPAVEERRRRLERYQQSRCAIQERELNCAARERICTERGDDLKQQKVRLEAREIQLKDQDTRLKAREAQLEAREAQLEAREAQLETRAQAANKHQEEVESTCRTAAARLSAAARRASSREAEIATASDEIQRIRKGAEEFAQLFRGAPVPSNLGAAATAKFVKLVLAYAGK
jgi:myosin heavy subunit